MPLLKTWAPYFRRHARQQGRSHYQHHRVKCIAPVEPELVRAEVTCDDHVYTVTFVADGAGTTACCTCPQTGGGSFCQHIWATLLDINHRDHAFAPEGQAVELINPRPPRARKRPAQQEPVRSAEPLWSARLDLLRPMAIDTEPLPPALPASYQVCYVVRPTLSAQHDCLVIELRRRYPTPSGYGRPSRLKIHHSTVHEVPDTTDRELCSLLLGAQSVTRDDQDLQAADSKPPAGLFMLSGASQRGLLKQLIATGRCVAPTADPDDQAPTPLSWDGDDPWILWLVGHRRSDHLEMDLQLRRGLDRMPIDGPRLLLGGPGGLAIYNNRAAPFEDHGASRWVRQFRDSAWSRDESTTIVVPSSDTKGFLDRLYRLPHLPRLDLPEGIGRRERHVQPTAHIDLFGPDAPGRAGLAPAPRNQVAGVAWFAYGRHRINPGQPGWFIADDDPSATDADQATENTAAALIRRDTSHEHAAIASLWPLGFRRHTANPSGGLSLLLPAKLMPDVAAELLKDGWVVTTDQRIVRSADPPRLSVTSGIDWFELRGTVRYHTDSGDQEIALPEILAAARAGKTTLTLTDGSQGVLPREWLTQNGLLAAIGKPGGDHVRFKSTQAVILDCLLSRQAHVNVDEKFDSIRRQLGTFKGIEPASAAATFQGELRPYQRDGLGWLWYLQGLTVGGILADDMGLGKTVQVLALLDGLYDQTQQENTHGHGGLEDAGDSGHHLPTLIAVPRSIVFNWIDEARRFAPKLRVQAYTGTDREALRKAFTDHDVIVTSYGLLRRDITELTAHRFRCVILDEAQAIKNPASQSAKAARLLDAQHRLALTGTPVENHVGDLWSIFEFLNPGMLGTNTRFAQMARWASQQGGTGLARPGDQAESPASPRARGAAQIAMALKPFILRRTKQQVLKDLPEKTEQTILCQMEPHQRQLYDQLLRHYRAALLDRRGPASGGGSLMADKTMMVLEALLRLRQAACHPGLIDPSRAEEPSAKLDVLMDRLQDLIEENHKALVFSQFTSMLALVRKQLDARGLIYEYLDGKTRNRAEPVKRFQNDPHCPLFLISLKAGGLGLNLTAAGYVFILDPWWNPAVEAQAIDRTHRIGQTRHVFAYRLICQDTVEQRIAQLQSRKRRLAEAIIGGQENVLRTLTMEDLQYLLGSSDG